MKKIFMFLILGIFLLSLVPAAEQTYEKDSPLNITITCNNGPSYCSSESVCNINVIDPTGAMIITNQDMDNEVSVHKYLMTPEVTGLYRVTGLCADGDLGQPIEFNFFVNPLGEQIEKPESNFYFAILFLVLLLFAMFLTIAILAPYQNKKEMRDGKEAITGVSVGKYVKIISFWIAWGFFMWFIAMINGISNNYVFFEGIKNMISNLYTFLSVLSWGVNLAMGMIFVWITWKDIILNKKILRSGQVFLDEL